jgi:transcriptional regulator with XRE-family HTH domain
MKRLPMRKIREALRLKAAGLTQREIAASVGVGRSTAGEYLERAKRAGLSWPLPDELDDTVLEQRLFSSAGGGHDDVQSPVRDEVQERERPQPDWAHMALLEAESDSITRSLIASAKQGDSTALRIIVDRLALAPAPRTPAREPYEVRPLDTVADCVNALRRITIDVASGELPGDHADEIAARINDQARIMEVEEFEQRIEILERAAGQEGRLQ